MNVYKVIVTMKDSGGLGNSIDFSLIVPAVSMDAARDAASNLGYLVNEATEHRLKISSTTAILISEEK